MEFDEYQARAKATDQFSQEEEKIIHPLLNLTESVGLLSRLVEQGHRQKELPRKYLNEKISQKLGDILWYLTNIAERRGLKLSDIAQSNLQRTDERWRKALELKGKHFDESSPIYEQMPRKFSMAFFEPDAGQKPRKIIVAVPSDHSEWIQVGDRIDDNAVADDGYRFHDVLHLANVAYLGWSPVIRALLKRKRKRDLTVDRVDDGARAVNIEEALTAFIFAHAKELGFFENASHVDFGILKTVETLTRGLEVEHRSYEEWENAILYGYKAFRELHKRGEGLVMVNLNANIQQRLVIGDLPVSVKKGLVPDS